MYATVANKVKALTNIKVFADLINFHGGWSKFGKVHDKLAGFVTAPQLAKLCLVTKDGTHPKQYNNRRLILMPRGHLKSTVCSTLYVLWRIYRNPNIRILVGTNKLELSQAFIRELRQYLEDLELQERVWNARPHISGRLIPVMDKAGKKRRQQKSDEDETDTEDKKLIWNLSAIQVLRDEVMKEPTVLATSAGTRVTGQHYDILILDDVVDFDNSSSEIKLNKVFEWCQDLESIIDPQTSKRCGTLEGVPFYDNVGDEVVVLGTRYEAADYYNHILSQYKELEYKVFIRNIHRNGQNHVKPNLEQTEYKVGDPSGEYIWKEKFTDEYVRRLRARTTPRRWASQYLNTIVAEGEQLLDVEAIRYFRSADVEKQDGGSAIVRVSGEKRLIKLFLVVDPAISQATRADNTVLTVGGVDEKRDVFIVDTKIGKFTPAQTCDYIYELTEKWNLFSVHIETNGVGAGLPYALKERFRTHRPLVIREMRHTTNKKERLEARLQPLFANQKLWFADWMASMTSIKEEVTFFPRETAKDDFLDTIDMLCEVAIILPSAKNKSRPRNRAYNKKWGGIR